MASSPRLVALLLAVVTAACGAASRKDVRSSPFGALPQSPPPASPNYRAEGKAESVVLTSSTAAGVEYDKAMDMAPASESDSGGGGPVATGAAEGTGQALTTTNPLPQPGEKMVVTGSVSVYVEDGGKEVETLRAWINAHRGKIVGEQLRGAGRSWTGDLRVRLPPEEVRGFVKALDDAGELTETSFQAEEVTRQYFDQELQVRALRVTLARLEKILAEKGLNTQEVLSIEREMERVRQQIESIEGEHRFLTDRIAFATIDVSLRVRGDVIFAPHAKFHPGPRFSVLFPIDAADEDPIAGGGVTLHIERELTFDLDLFPADGARERIVFATLGGATYSDFVGAGKNRFLNPYLGLRTGYAHSGKGSAWLVGAEVGLELLKLPWLLVEVAGRSYAIVDEDGADLAAQFTAGFEIPF